MNEKVELAVRDGAELDHALALAQHTVYKRYLSELGRYPLVKPTQILLGEKPEDCIRLLHLEELDCKHGEDIFQKLSTVYHASMSLGCNLIVMIDVERIGAPVKVYVGVRSSEEHDGKNISRKALTISYNALKSGMQSNFPGTKSRGIPSQNELPGLMDNIFGIDAKYISSVSCVASVRDKSKTQDKLFIQGLERFVDAMQGNAYTALFLAEPVGEEQQMRIRSGYESLYSTLSSFGKSVWSYSENESAAVMDSLSRGTSQAIAEGTSNTQAHTNSVGMNMGLGSSNTNGMGRTRSESEGSGASWNVGSSIRNIGGVLRFMNPAVGGIVEALGDVVESAIGTSSASQTVGEAVSNTVSRTLGINVGGNAGHSTTRSDTSSHTETETRSETRTRGRTDTLGTGMTLQIENVNKPIQEMLDRIEEQLKRTQEGEDYGTYSCAAYFLSGRQESSLLAANTYRALMIGEGSSVENGAINFWDGQENPESVKVIKEYLRRFVHPIFAMPVAAGTGDTDNCVMYTPGTIVSGLELPMHLGLPTRSVYGLPVLEHAEFGRNVMLKNRSGQPEDESKINLGCIYHMGQEEQKSKVALNLSELTAHTFVTGSTGAGKSNTVYRMLEGLTGQGVNFLVVEPAKGEYKNPDAFGGRDDVIIFGTNHKIAGTELLRINPFSFPEHTHVLEHMDRLVEIFNVCWPMYAAMPAILKDAIQRAYEDAGWDIAASENRYSSQLFPSFADVLRQIRLVLNESEYSQDNKGDYTGALVTRVKSLTNGLNGLMFRSDEIAPEILFDRNVIVDLSRVGSTETKALIM